MPDIRQQKLAKELLNPENKTMKEASLKAGYSGKGRTQYRASTKRNIEKIFNQSGITKDSLTKAFKELSALTLAEGDYSNTNRAYENIGKIQGVIQPNETKQVAIFSNIEGKLDTLAGRLKTEVIDKSEVKPEGI